LILNIQVITKSVQDAARACVAAEQLKQLLLHAGMLLCVSEMLRLMGDTFV